MNRSGFAVLAFLVVLPLAGQDVYRPPVPIGILEDGRTRKPKEPIPFPSEKREWTRVRSARFDTVSSAGGARTQQIVADLETLADALAGKDSRPSRSGGTKIFIFSSRRDVQPYFDLLFARDRAPATGAYIRHGGSGTMVIDASRWHTPRTAMHELIHDLLRRRGPAPPLWIEEGLAEYFSSSRIDKGRVTAGRIIREHTLMLHQRKGVPLRELFEIRRETPAAASTMFYAQSWAAVHWLMGLDHHAFFQFVSDVTAGVETGDALQRHFGRTIEQMELALRWRDRSPHRVVIEAPQAELPAASSVDRATLLFELGAFLARVAGAESERDRHFEEALRVDPRHAKTLAALGRFDEAVAAAPDDPDIHLIYAYSLAGTAIGRFAGVFEPAEGDAERFRKARVLAQEALELGADEALARAVIGTSYLVEDDLRPGIAELEAARALAPRREDVALNLLAMYLSIGDRERAEALFSWLEGSPNRQTVFAAKNVFLTAEAARANALSAEGKLDEAAAVVRELAARTPDERGRAELERDAAKLETLGAVNRHITQYNEAVTHANAGNRHEAIAILDALLAIATDEQVLADARKLRDELVGPAARRP